MAMTWVVGLGLVLLGLGIGVIWTRDIVAGEQVDLSDGLFAAREDSGSLLWPHWLAEYATAVTCLVGGIGVIVGTGWGAAVAGIGSGALLYTSVNSLGWAFASPARRPYAVPMIAGALVGLVAAAWLVATTP